MIAAVADTHALIWAIFADPRLSATARTTIETILAQGDEVGISAITLVELVYLVEKQKLPAEALRRTLDQLRDLASQLVSVPVTAPIAEIMSTIPRSEVPDMPDRIISATAVQLQVPLISRDGKIRLSAVPTIW